MSSLVEHGRIRTTVAKAKELRRHIEKAITVGKKGDLHARRLLISRTGKPETARVLVEDLGVRFKARKGGYTRIIKAGHRPGDCAEMAFIEFVDYTAPVKASPETVKADKNSTAKAKSSVKLAEKKRKNLRGLQGSARRTARA